MRRRFRPERARRSHDGLLELGGRAFSSASFRAGRRERRRPRRSHRRHLHGGLSLPGRIASSLQRCRRLERRRLARLVRRDLRPELPLRFRPRLACAAPRLRERSDARRSRLPQTTSVRRPGPLTRGAARPQATRHHAATAARSDARSLLRLLGAPLFERHPEAPCDSPLGGDDDLRPREPFAELAPLTLELGNALGERIALLALPTTPPGRRAPDARVSLR